MHMDYLVPAIGWGSFVVLLFGSDIVYVNAFFTNGQLETPKNCVRLGVLRFDRFIDPTPDKFSHTKMYMDPMPPKNPFWEKSTQNNALLSRAILCLFSLLKYINWLLLSGTTQRMKTNENVDSEMDV